MTNKVLLALIVCLSPVLTFSKPLSDNWKLKSGQLTYQVSYTLKSITGTSKDLKGKGQCQNGRCRFLIAVPVESFKSGDSSRDLNMITATKAALHPLIKVTATLARKLNLTAFATSATIEFAGHNKTYKSLNLSAKQQADGSMRVTGTLPLKLSDFQIERPSLLGIAIKDPTPVDIDLLWTAE